MFYRISPILAALSCARLLLCQEAEPGERPNSPTSKGIESGNPAPPERKRLLGIVPNYRTSASLDHYEPLTTKEKFNLASQDAFDRGTVGLAALFAGQGQLSNSNRSFGQGGRGFGRYLGAAYGDFVIGDYMTEAVFPTLLRQDPRYFRRGTGSGWSRFRYATGQIFWTHSDTGATQFNYSEVIGNSTAVAVSTAYYADNRTARDSTVKLGMQLGVDMASNILKEFWPDLERKFGRKHAEFKALKQHPDPASLRQGKVKGDLK